jgi:Txe/YoeB family toxin of toxin-antitoxin system
VGNRVGTKGTKEAKKDIAKLTPKLKQKLKTIIQDTISINPYAGKKLVGDLAGFYSVRLSYQDRIVYTIDDEQNLIYIHRAKTHYGE